MQSEKFNQTSQSVEYLLERTTSWLHLISIIRAQVIRITSTHAAVSSVVNVLEQPEVIKIHSDSSSRLSDVIDQGFPESFETWSTVFDTNDDHAVEVSLSVNSMKLTGKTSRGHSRSNQGESLSLTLER
jgi:hypothetical protein